MVIAHSCCAAHERMDGSRKMSYSLMSSTPWHHPELLSRGRSRECFLGGKLQQQTVIMIFSRTEATCTTEDIFVKLRKGFFVSKREVFVIHTKTVLSCLTAVTPRKPVI